MKPQPSGDRAWRTVPELLIVQWGLPINLGWEFLHTPLYTDAGRGIGYLFWTRLHCGLGDVLISLGAFWTASLLARNRFWWVRPEWKVAGAFLGTGLAYTAWSEWFSTHVTGAWAYSPLMPRILGIGLTPLLQWIIVPAMVIALVRRGRSAPLDPHRSP